jgi:uncharacterized membrane protein
MPITGIGLASAARMTRHPPDSESVALACPTNEVPVARGARADIGIQPMPDDATTRIVAIVKISAIAAQLLLLIVVVRQLDILPIQYRRLLYLCAGGFLLNHFLPAAWRAWAFVAMSLGGLGFMLGEPQEPWRVWDAGVALSSGAVVGGLGLLVIGICLLRIGFWQRVTLLVLSAIGIGFFRASSHGLAAERAGYVLAALFMTRTMIFLYDVSTWRRPTLREAIGYFFLAPNAAPYNFPNLDFKTFCRSHYTADAFVVYQRGVRWMARGILQLVILDWSARHLAIRLEAVQTGRDIIQYLVSNYLSYLAISGPAHFGIGLLLLFGFNLPETHHRYVLASSFTDFWRRVNIYWKDFMQKVFYMPTFFHLRKFGHERALVLATAWVFVVSWAIHLWGTWWLTLKPWLTLSNTIFWASIGTFVVVNVVWENRHGRRGRSGATRSGWRDDVRLLARTATTFVTVAILMTLLNHPDFGVWLRMWTKFDLQTLVWLGLMVSVVLSAKLAFEILPERGLRPTTAASVRAALRFVTSDATACVLTLLTLYVVASIPFLATSLSAAGR